MLYFSEDALNTMASLIRSAPGKEGCKKAMVNIRLMDSLTMPGSDTP